MVKPSFDFRVSIFALVVLAMGILSWAPVPKVEAQFAGQSAFQVPFTIQSHTSDKIIPPCISALPTATAPCLPNRNQLGHTITWSFDAGAGGGGCFLFQGSNDNVNWQTIAAGTSSGLTTGVSGMSYANGYFTYLRIDAICASLQPLRIVYTGYSQPIPINPVSESIRSISVGNAATLGNFFTPYIVNGFQCFNPNNTVSSGTAAFTGSGLNDLTKTGTYGCAGGRAYRVQIDSVGATDTFKWSNDGGTTFEATLVAMTGAAQLLECGLSVTFGATTGHTLNDRWDFTATDGTAYLQIFPSVTDPPFYEIGIPPAQAFSYSGAPIVSPKISTNPFFKVRAAPAPGQITTLTSDLDCSFQVNPYGPFYPIAP
jgi:hypothetical protein